jgi:hypothetical protein
VAELVGVPLTDLSCLSCFIKPHDSPVAIFALTCFCHVSNAIHGTRTKRDPINSDFRKGGVMMVELSIRPSMTASKVRAGVMT